MAEAAEIREVISALSARLSVVEIALASIVSTDRFARAEVLSAFDAHSQVLLDSFIVRPIEDAYLELVRRSIADVRKALGGAQSE